MARRANLKHVPRKRYIKDRSLTPLPPDITITSATHGAGSPNVTMVFSTPVLYPSTTPPGTMRIGSKTATAYVSKNALGCVITFSGVVAAAETLTISPNDPAVRNAAGGFIQPVALATV